MDALGVGPELSFGGKVYRLAPLTLVHYAMFSAWLERQAWEGIERAKPALSPRTYDDALSRVARDVAAGMYDLGSPAFAQAAGSMSGLKQLVLLSLRDSQKDIPEKDRESIDQELVDRLFDQKMKQIMTLVKQANFPVE